MPSFAVPRSVSRILNTLSSAGFEAWAVGGCVRDSLLGRVPGDWDITTSALPEQVKALFHRTVDTGIAHGTVTVMIGREGYEVTTYRVDGTYSDGRHPDSVTFTPSLSEDLRRRDFTVNAMAYHPKKGLVDLFGGLHDLQNGVIRAVGDPNERFDEDALRILRAVRFSAQLGFTIEEETFSAIRRFAGRLTLVSAERIRTELMKLLLSPHPEIFRRLYESGITAVIFPEFDAMMDTPQNTPFHCCSVGEHTLKVLAAAESDPVLRLAALLHDVGKISTRTTDAGGRDHFKGHGSVSAAFAEKFLKELRFDNATLSLVTRLIRVHDDRFAPTQANVRRAIRRMGEDLFPYYVQFILADNRGKSAFAAEEFLPRYETLLASWEEVRRLGDCVSLKTLALSGADLIAAGIRPGPALGQLLNSMLDDVLAQPEHNTREYLSGRYLTERRPHV